MIDKVKSIIEDLKDEIFRLSDYILENPELGYEEFKACKAHVELLRKHGFEVIEEYMGIQTAFRAEICSGKEGPKIAFLSEYDALPGVGHGCGHNLLGAVSTGAGIVLSKIISELKGTVVVIGTPAEETSGAKVHMADNEAFDDISIALAAHPSDFHFKSGKSLALEAIEFKFKGKSAHAASHPDKGVNALDAAINTFNNINALREHIRSDARVHGVIIDGGKAANVVPDLSISQFYVRASTKEYLVELRERVINCAKGASLAAGTEIEIRNYEASYDNLITNQVLSQAYCTRLRDMGIESIDEPRQSYGSLDMGNVSHICPVIHPYFGISDREIIGHTKEFAQATKTPMAYNSSAKTIGALVLTAVDVLKDNDLLQRIWEEFRGAKK